MTTGSAGGVQSVSRALDMLELMVERGGEIGLSELSERAGLPMPTIHRLLRTLLAHGYVRQLPSRRYALGPALIRLGEAAGAGLGTAAEPFLSRLTDSTGETANLAMIDGDRVVYVAQSASRHAMRMFTEVGRRVHAHSTGVGKAILAQLPEAQVRAILTSAGMPGATVHTITEPGAMLSELERIRTQGYSVDEGEQELGVRCVAVAVPGASTPTAVSVSGPDARLTLDRVEQVVPELHAMARELSAIFDARAT